MIRFVLIGFLTFSMVGLLLPLPTYAISLDDDEEDAEDVADLLEQAKKAAKNESFDKAKELLKKAKLYGTNSDDIKQTQKYVKAKKEARDKRLEKQRKEKERLTRLKRERERIARRASLASQSGSSYRGAITMCYPSIPKPIDYSKCSGAKTASGKYATVQLSRGSKSVIDGKANCFDLSIYANGSYGNGNTCGGVNGGWSIRTNGQSGYANGLGNAIAWLLKRM